MANKVTIKASVEFAPEGRVKVGTGDLVLTYETTDKSYLKGTQVFDDTGENLIVGDVASIGYLVLANRSSAVNASVGLSGQYCILLLPGQVAVFPPTGTIHIKSSSAETDVEIEFIVIPVKAEVA